MLFIIIINRINKGLVVVSAKFTKANDEENGVFECEQDEENEQ